MRAILLTCLVTATFASLLPGQRRRNRAPAEMQHFSYAEKRFASEAVGREMDYGVYLPKGYADEQNADRKWPLIIWLHGMWEDHNRFHHRGGAPLLDKAVADGKLPPCIFVTANGGRSSMYVNREDQRWEDLISEDLLAHLTKEYRIDERRERRAIMGVSMGGMGALRIAFTKPDLFGAVGAHSSAVFAEDPEDLPPRLKQYATRLGLDEVFGDPIEKEPWQKANPVCIANRVDKQQLERLRIYFDAGSDDRYGFQVGNTLLHEALKKRGVEHTWRLIEGGGHSWGNEFQDEALPHSFAFVGQMFLREPKSDPSEDGAPKEGARKERGPQEKAKDAGGGEER